MTTLISNPPVTSAPRGAPFVQELRLSPDDAPIATAHWHAPANLAEGVAQLIRAQSGAVATGDHATSWRHGR